MTTTTMNILKNVGHHALVLFYSSMDARLLDSIRKHGINGVKRAFVRLDHWRSRPEENEDGEEIEEEEVRSEVVEDTSVIVAGGTVQ